MTTKRKPAAFVAPPPVPLTPAEEMRVAWLVCLDEQAQARYSLSRAIEAVRYVLDDLERTAVVRGDEPRSGQTGVFQCSAAEVDHLAARIPALIDTQRKIETLAAAFGVELVLTEAEAARYLPTKRE